MRNIEQTLGTERTEDLFVNEAKRRCGEMWRVSYIVKRLQRVF